MQPEVLAEPAVHIALAPGCVPHDRMAQILEVLSVINGLPHFRTALPTPDRAADKLGKPAPPRHHAAGRSSARPYNWRASGKRLASRARPGEASLRLCASMEKRP